MMDFHIVHLVKIPANLPLGDYVLSFRWDCEQTPQIWMQCADIKDKQNYIMRWKELQPDKVAEREAFESRALQSLLAEEGEQDLAVELARTT